MIKLVILDRDGVINENLVTSVRNLSEFRLLKGVEEAITRLNKLDLRVVVATNQAVVGRGHLTREELGQIHRYMTDALASKGAHLNHIYCCTDAEPSFRRKPGAGMILQAMDDFYVEPSQTIFVGDAARDLEAAHAAGCYSALVLTGHGEETAKTLSDKSIPIFKDLSDFVTRYFKDHI